ncbi:MAG: glycosyltransferase family 4 protein [Gammaproteobacteria bacterium]
MRIAFLGLKGIPFPAGIENFTEEVGCRLAARGHDVTVYVRPYVSVAAQYRGMRIIRLPSINTKHLDALTHTFLGALHVLGTRPDVVHIHALGPSVFAVLPRLVRIATVVQVHGLDWEREKWGAFARTCLHTAEYPAVYFPHRTIAISRTLQNYFSRRYGRDVDYVPTGVAPGNDAKPELIRDLGLEPDSYVLFLGRLVPEKGCHYLLEAWKDLGTAKKLVMAGPASHTEDYADLLRRSSGENVIFTGAVGGRLLDELYANAYLYVLPSDVEGLPHSLLHALSFGKCALASDIDANREALGDCGVTFRKGDVADLREHLRALLADPEAVRALGARGRERAREYDWDNVVDRLEAVYRRTMASRSTG